MSQIEEEVDAGSDGQMSEITVHQVLVYGAA